ncbi:MAG: protein kinase [Polyangiaceae bacterium]|nr:protein kinase [Polyangiaceae bacterium]
MKVTLVGEKPIGQGAYTNVWRGRDDLDRDVAVKIVRPDQQDGFDLMAHARLLAQTSHPNVVTVFTVDKVHDPETNTDCDCIIMEFVPEVALLNSSGARNLCSCTMLAELPTVFSMASNTFMPASSCTTICTKKT